MGLDPNLSIMQQKKKPNYYLVHYPPPTNRIIRTAAGAQSGGLTSFGKSANGAYYFRENVLDLLCTEAKFGPPRTGPKMTSSCKLIPLENKTIQLCHARQNIWQTFPFHTQPQTYIRNSYIHEYIGMISKTHQRPKMFARLRTCERLDLVL